MSRKTNILPDAFDVRVINDLIESDDAFALFYRKDALNGILLVDKDFDLRGDFIRENIIKIGEALQVYREGDDFTLKAIKFMLVEIAEAMSNALQHILAKDRGVPVSGYIDTLNKAKHYGIISDSLFIKIKPFFDFRNSLIHRYRLTDDAILLKNIREGYRDFDRFIDEIEDYMQKVRNQD